MPAEEMAARLGVGQEHCCNYNMMRLSQYLLRWTGDRGLCGLLGAQIRQWRSCSSTWRNGHDLVFLRAWRGQPQNMGLGNAAFLVLSRYACSSNASYETQIFMEDEQGVTVSQWIPSSVRFEREGREIGLRIEQDGQNGIYPLNGWSVTGMTAITKVDSKPIPVHRPDRFIYRLTVACSRESEFTLKLRLPWWLNGAAEISVNGAAEAGPFHSSSYYELKRVWRDGDIITVELPKKLTTEQLPGEPDTAAFMDGPIVLAGLVDEERRLYGDPELPESLLVPDRERHHGWWNPGYYRTAGQDRGIRFIPLYEIKDEAYTVYFPIKNALQ